MICVLAEQESECGRQGGEDTEEEGFMNNNAYWGPDTGCETAGAG